MRPVLDGFGGRFHVKLSQAGHSRILVSRVIGSLTQGGGGCLPKWKSTPCTVEMARLKPGGGVPTWIVMARKKNSGPAEKAPAWPLDKRLPAHKLVKVSQFARCDAELVEKAKILEIADLLWFPEGTSEAEHDAKIVKAIDLFDSINPADGIESMLAVQMVGTHHAVVECLRRSKLQGQTTEGRNFALIQAQRLMALYGQQVAALDKHRGKGQQKIIVERVEVAAGGQAIVGDVHTTKSAVRPPSQQQEALEAPREDTVPLEAPLSRAKAPR